MSEDRIGFDAQKEMSHLKNIVNRDDHLIISSRFIKYLIGQVDRVKDLERKIKIDSELFDMIVQQNKRYRKTVEVAIGELEYALNSNKSKDVKKFYVENAKRILTEALEEESE